MSKYGVLQAWIAVACLLSMNGSVRSQKITDTIFYNRKWQLCEKPLAAYYRIGTLVADSLWYYTGKFVDRAVDGRLVAEGEYNQGGERDGLFRFYYPDGKLMIRGKFWKSFMIGDWEWYYNNDSLRSIINFDGPSDDFKFVRHKMPDGKVLMENSTGSFEWYTDIYYTGLPRYKVYGSFSNGKRSGTWRYYSVDKGVESFEFSEKYDKEGNFKRGMIKASHSADNPTSRFKDYVFVPPTLWTTEQMFYDGYFMRGDTAAPVALLSYLLNRTSSEIIVRNREVQHALVSIIRSLEVERGRMDFRGQPIDGVIEFKIGEKGYPEDLSVTGEAVTNKDKEFIRFLVSKFRRLEMESSESVAIEAYYKIYFFSVDMKEYVPAALRNQVGYEVFFTTIPKEKFLVLLESQKKNIKKFIREEIRYYW